MICLYGDRRNVDDQCSRVVSYFNKFFNYRYEINLKVYDCFDYEFLRHGKSIVVMAKDIEFLIEVYDTEISFDAALETLKIAAKKELGVL